MEREELQKTGIRKKIDEAIVVHDGLNLVYLWDGDLRALFSDFKNNLRLRLMLDERNDGSECKRKDSDHGNN